MQSSIAHRSSNQSITTSTRRIIKRLRSAVLAVLFVGLQILSPVPALVHAEALETDMPSVGVQGDTTPVPTPATNPSLSQACGLDIALVIDNSNSISSSEMTSMKNALKDFTNALAGTPTQFSVTRFGTSASVVSGFSANVATTNTAINSVSTGGGGTNWEDGLLKSGSTFDPRADKPNLVIFASDGNPTYHNGGGNGSSTSQADIDAAITQANVIKNGGTRMLALGIGNGLDVDNLKAISGPNANTGSVLTSDVITSNFDTLSAQLADFANQTCGSTITTTKLIDQDGNLNTTNDQAPAANWSFDINGSPSDPNPVSTDANGQTPAVKVNAGTYSVNEVQQASYQLIAASCTGASSNGSKQGDSVSGVTVANNNIVSCTFINTPRPTTLKLVKTVVNNNGGTKQASDFQAKIDGNNVAWSTVVNVAPGIHNASEANLPGYQAGNWGGDCAANGSITLTKGQSAVCTITNDDMPASLKVVKKVVNPYGNPTAASSFPLYVNGQLVTSGATNQYDAGGYILSETGLFGYEFTGVSGDCVYQQTTINVLLGNGQQAECIITNTAVQPKLIVIKHVINNNGGEKTASDFTMTVAGNSQSVPNFAGNENGTTIGLNEGDYAADELSDNGYSASYSDDCSATIAVGDIKTCTITNDDIAPTLTLHKQVINDNGGNATAGDWTLTATPEDSGVASLSGNGANGFVNKATQAHETYNLSESGPSGYTAGEWDCYSTSGVFSNPSGDPSQIRMSEGANVVCTITNNDTPVPGIHVVKSGPAHASAGSEVSYTFTVTNTGNEPLDHLTVVDSITGNAVYVSGDTNSNDELDTTETWLYTATYEIPADQTADVVNTVTACGNEVESIVIPEAASVFSTDSLRANLVQQVKPDACAQDSHRLTIDVPVVITPPPTLLAGTGTNQPALLLMAFGLFNLSSGLALLEYSRRKNVSTK